MVILDFNCDVCGKTNTEVGETIHGFLCVDCYELYESIYGTSDDTVEKPTRACATGENGLSGCGSGRQSNAD